MATAAEDRPPINGVVHTADLPPTPTRDHSIWATQWVEVTPELLQLGDDIGIESSMYKRRIGRFLLWRAGPAVDADARYLAIDAGALSVSYSFRLYPDGTGSGVGADGETHQRFRTWKESLRDAG